MSAAAKSAKRTMRRYSDEEKAQAARLVRRADIDEGVMAAIRRTKKVVLGPSTLTPEPRGSILLVAADRVIREQPLYDRLWPGG